MKARRVRDARACDQKHASDKVYTQHLIALREAHRMGITEGLPRVAHERAAEEGAHRQAEHPGPAVATAGRLEEARQGQRLDGAVGAALRRRQLVGAVHDQGVEATAMQYRSKGYDRVEEISKGTFEKPRATE